MASISTEEDVVNIALARIGDATSISDLDTNTTNQAVQARRVYYNIRDQLMRSHTWNFLTRRVQLTDSASDPTFGWDEGYTLPSDYLRVTDVLATDSFADRIPYRIEKQALGTAATTTDVILCNSSTAFLIYIYKETDPSLWTVDFADAVAWRLAAELALVLPVSNTKYELLDRKAERALLNAKSIDGQEDYPREFALGSWISDRWNADVDGTPQ